MSLCARTQNHLLPSFGLFDFLLIVVFYICRCKVEVASLCFSFTFLNKSMCASFIPSRFAHRRSNIIITIINMMLDHAFIYTPYFTTYFTISSLRPRARLCASKSFLIFVLYYLLFFFFSVSLFSASSSCIIIVIVVVDRYFTFGTLQWWRVFFSSASSTSWISYCSFESMYIFIYCLHFPFGSDSENNRKTKRRKIDRNSTMTTTTEDDEYWIIYTLISFIFGALLALIGFQAM